MEDIARLARLLDFAKAHGLAERLRVLRAGDLAIELSPPVPSLPSPAAEVEQPLSPHEQERRDLEALLWSSGADVSPFLTREVPTTRREDA